MRRMPRRGREPRSIGYCAGCGGLVTEGEAYFLDGGQLIHAESRLGVLARPGGAVAVSCLLAYLAETCLEEETARAMGMERRGGPACPTAF